MMPRLSRTRKWFQTSIAFAAAALLVLHATQVPAQLPKIKLYAIYPAGGQTGSTFDLTVTNGEDLENADRLYFNHPGIQAKQKTNDNGEPVANTFVVSIEGNVPVGTYEVRLGGKFGVSNPRAFVVGERKELHESESNNEPEQASQIEINSVVNGRSNGNSDIDYFKFTAKKGQRLLADVKAIRIDSKMLPTLELYGPSGRRLMSSYDDVKRDALLDFTPEADGEYMLKVYDFVYGGGNDYVYRLTLHNGPHIDFVLPPAAPPGTQSKFTLYGRNLPGGQPAGELHDGAPIEKLDVTINVPDDPTARPVGDRHPIYNGDVDAFVYRFTSPQGNANPISIQYAAEPVVMEQEPNDEPGQANAVEPPLEFAGQFQDRGDIDYFTFEAAAKQTYWIEVFGQRFGTTADPYLTIEQVTKDKDGNENVRRIATADDTAPNLAKYRMTTQHSDPVYKFVAPAEGTYRVSIRDRYFEARGDVRLVYRVAVSPTRPDFRLVVVPVGTQQNDNTPATTASIGLRKGENYSVDVIAFRRHGFNGPIEIKAENLPKGVTCRGAVIDGTQSRATLVFTAAEDAPEGFSTARIVGSAKIHDPDKLQVVATAEAALKSAADAIPNLQKAVEQQKPNVEKTEAAKTAAEKTTADLLAKRKEAETKQKQAAEKLKAAQDALAKATDEDDKKAKQQAVNTAQNEKKTADAEFAKADQAYKQAKQASDKAIAAFNAASKKLKAAQDALAAGQKKVNDAEAALQAAEKAEQAAIAEVSRDARPATVAWSGSNNDAPIVRLAQSLGVSVQKEAAPYQVTTEVDRVEVNQSRQVLIPVKLAKRNEFDNNVNLTFVGQPKNVQIKNAPIKKGESEGLYRVFVPSNAPLGTYTLYLKSQGQVAYRRNPERVDEAKAEQAAAAENQKKADEALKKATATRDEANKKADEAAKNVKTATDNRTKAEQDKKTAEANLKKATDAQAAAAKKVTDAEKTVKDAEKKVAEAKKAADADASKKPQLEAAEKELAAAQDKLKKAQEAKKAAEEALAKAKTELDKAAKAFQDADKALKDAQAAQKAAVEALKKADAEFKKADAAKKAADAEKKSADKKVQDATNAAKPKNINVFPPSTPVTITIKRGPATLSASVPGGGNIKRGKEIDIKVTIKRTNGFAGPATLSLPLPPGVKGLTAEPVTIPADQTEGVLTVKATGDATEGQLQNMVIRATMDFDGKAAVDQPINLKVSK